MNSAARQAIVDRYPGIYYMHVSDALLPARKDASPYERYFIGGVNALPFKTSVRAQGDQKILTLRAGCGASDSVLTSLLVLLCLLPLRKAPPMCVSPD